MNVRFEIRRMLSMLLAVMMVVSMLPVDALAAVGTGAEDTPWQLGDEVTVDGAAEPVGATVDNSKWEFVSKVEACSLE